jgi:poly(3-hydroxybutyrate) depolymerase
MRSYRNLVVSILGWMLFIIPPALWGQLDLALTFTDASGNTMPYRLFIPVDNMTPGEEIPIVLFLHGAGEKGSDNTQQVASHVGGLITATQGSQFTAVLVAPQLPDQGSNRWFNTIIDNGDGTATTAFAMVLGMLEKAMADYSVDRNRQYLTGLSLGGEGTWVLAQDNPGRFAAIAPMSGRTSLFTWKVDALKEIPTWVYHGVDDTVVPFIDSVNLVTAIRNAGGQPLFSRVDGNHTIWAPIYSGGIYSDDATGYSSDLYTWMFSHTLTSPPAPVLNIQTDGTDWLIEMPSEEGVLYQLKSSQSLDDPVASWVSAALPQAGTGAVLSFLLPVADWPAAPTRFFIVQADWE